MDSSSIGGPFPPISSWPQQAVPIPKSVAGERLFEETSQFYEWYLSWDASPSEHARSFECLSQIMRIAQTSKEGGGFLSSTQETSALNSLSSLKDDISNGYIRINEIQTSLLQILQNLTDANPKARLVSQTTKLEYLLCVHPSRDQSKDITGRYQQLLSHIISQVTPNMLDSHANAISQGLSKILDNPESVSDIHQALHEAIKGWL